MSKILSFTKAVASGNDFIILSKTRSLTLGLKKLSKKLCARKHGVGADGLLILDALRKDYDFRMRIFNPDGSEAEMCGNGIRCASLYWWKLENKKGMRIKTKAGAIESKILSNKNAIKVKMSDPRGLKLNLKIKIDNKNYNVHYIDSGVPHAIVFVDDLESVDVNVLGKKIRFHKSFSPRGANVDFVKIVDDRNIEVRTYERGVEAQTLACGTGCVASSLITGCILKLKGRRLINANTLSAESLKIYFDIKNNRICDVWLQGQAAITFKGQVKL